MHYTFVYGAFLLARMSGRLFSFKIAGNFKIYET